MIQLYVTYLYPGSFFNEESTKMIDTIDDISLPKAAYGYRTFKREIIQSPDTDRSCQSATFESTPVTYEDAEHYTLKQLRELFPDERVLISNIENNDYHGAVRTRRGNWQPWEVE